MAIPGQRDRDLEIAGRTAGRLPALEAPIAVALRFFHAAGSEPPEDSS
jgi:hypothetical protein